MYNNSQVTNSTYYRNLSVDDTEYVLTSNDFDLAVLVAYNGDNQTIADNLD
jgi:hypothetical protein